jgi:hypothetical protein
MRERKLLKIDPLFTNCFFELTSQDLSIDDLRTLVKFPLPKSAETFSRR